MPMSGVIAQVVQGIQQTLSAQVTVDSRSLAKGTSLTYGVAGQMTITCATTKDTCVERRQVPITASTTLRTRCADAAARDLKPTHV